MRASTRRIQRRHAGVHGRAGWAPSFAEGLRWGSEIFQALRRILHARGLNTNVGDEGCAPSLPSNESAVRLVTEAIETAGYRAGDDVVICLDPAATEFFQDDHYVLAGEGEPDSGSDDRLLEVMGG
ncbi:MAG: hypothetical protein R2839_10540 [Thermomicrobiales bacterium]